MSKCFDVIYASKDTRNEFALAFDQGARKQSNKSICDDDDITEEENEETDSEYEEERPEQSSVSKNLTTLRLKRTIVSTTDKRRPLAPSMVSPLEGSNGLQGERRMHC